MNASYHGKKRDSVSRREERPGTRIVVESGWWGTCHVSYCSTSIRAVTHGRRDNLISLSFSIQQPVQPEETSEPAKRSDEEKLEDISDGG
jgi:hypothetical protein